MASKIVNKALFGRKVKEYREKAGYTQFSLSDTIGVSQNFLGDIERGIKLPSIETLIRLSNVLKVSLDTLFSASLDNVVAEDEDVVYTDKQLAVLKNVVKVISQNFND